jgi:hypothetical protein
MIWIGGMLAEIGEFIYCRTTTTTPPQYLWLAAVKALVQDYHCDTPVSSMIRELSRLAITFHARRYNLTGSTSEKFSLEMHIEELHNPLEALVLAMLLPWIAHVPSQREAMFDAFEDLDLILVLSLVHYINSSTSTLLRERDIVRGAR